MTFIPEILICIGIPNQCFNYILDTTSSISFVPGLYVKDKFKLIFDQTVSSTYKNTYTYEIFTYQSHQFAVQVAQDFILFPSEMPHGSNPFMTFALINDVKDPRSLRDVEGILGLSKYYYDVSDIKDPHNKQNKLIPQTLFAITNPKDSIEILYFGEIPEQFKKNGKQIGVCESKYDVLVWNCPFNMVTINKN